MTLDLANEPAIRLNHVRQTDREDGLLSSSAYHRIIRIIIGESSLHGRLKFKKSLPLGNIGYRVSGNSLTHAVGS